MVNTYQKQLCNMSTVMKLFDSYIAVQIKAFDQALTECLDNTNFIINDLGGVGIKDEISDMPQWDTWDPSYKADNTTPTEN